MADLESLLNDLANLDAQHDLEGMRQVRERIVEEHPDTDAAVEALYKIGLDFLFRQRDMMAAVETFATAAKRKHPFWSNAARTSLGLCYYHQKRTQKALFELRRVAYPSDKANVHSVTALAFIENIFETEGNADEAKRVRKDRISQLKKLIEDSRANHGPVSERAYHMYQLGVALKDDGDNDEATAVLEKAKEKGPEALGADLYRAVVELLND